MLERTVYQCEHCKANKSKPKIYFSKDRMYYHERSCFYNPERKSCCTCIHNSFYADKYINPWGGEECGGVNHCCNQIVIDDGGFNSNRPRTGCENWSDNSD